ncbi:UDP-glucose/GDP-mannose dehydrogenase family protein [Thiomicrospira microaerophila]|uniref:UDP-glucose dehydrogenase family protein n=1 Tax=Thiomicrospira microaerophila TaxID=406020 RepID=UPI00200D0965|nr:UDP-glucose/GDP-mannose dehydrogenase family protein [Thiomicrospira microaerophila]UQB41825.1 UDP-glucose/GDP-mannose dehydrogenase family protein [Thiomicrospira microaerophila]
MKISVFGCELTGLVTAGALAHAGNDVMSLPVGYVKVDDLNANRLPRDEPGLNSLIAQQKEEGRLRFEADWSKGIAHGQVLILSTPSWRMDRAEAVIKLIGETVKSDVLVVNQSTFPIGTADRFEAKLKLAFAERGVVANVAVVAMPDFLSEGSAIDNFMRPDRIVLGGTDKAALKVMRDLMRPFNRVTDQIKVMSTRAAEYTKYAVNALLATRISLINELANNAEHFNVDFEEVRQGLGSDKRIGFSYLYPGCGFGGPSFAADVKSLVATLQGKGYDADLLRTVLSNNETQKEVLFRKAWRFFDNDLRGIKIGVWGLSFKPNTATVENAPSLKALEAFVAQGAQVQAYDPTASADFSQHWGARTGVVLVDDMYKALDGVDALVILTEWKMFWSPDFKQMKQRMRQPVIFDGRNIFEPELIEDMGFRYFAVGRGEIV